MNLFSDVYNSSKEKCKSKKIRIYHRNLNGERSYSIQVNDTIQNQLKNSHSNRLFLSSIRIAFGFLTVLLIILCLINGLLYGLDLIIQSSCQLVHYNQPFLISLVSGKHK